MDWERIAANWQHYKASMQRRWGRISDLELERIAGCRERLATHIHQLYGISRSAAQMQLESWQGAQKEPGAA